MDQTFGGHNIFDANEILICWTNCDDKIQANAVDADLIPPPKSSSSNANSNSKSKRKNEELALKQIIWMIYQIISMEAMQPQIFKNPDASDISSLSRMISSMTVSNVKNE